MPCHGDVIVVRYSMDMTEHLSFFSKKVESSKTELPSGFTSPGNSFKNYIGSLSSHLAKVKEKADEIGFSPYLLGSIFLVLAGLAVSGYSLSRLFSDSHLVCAADSQLMTSNEITNSIQKDELHNTSGDLKDEQIDMNNGESSEIVSSEGQEITIDISGAVKKPGLYQLPTQTRVGDAIAVAGGLSSQASAIEVAQSMNLASKIQDGQKLYIPFIGEDLTAILHRGEVVAHAYAGKTGQVVEVVSQSVNRSDTGPTSDGKQTGMSTTTQTGESKKVSINTASSTQLMELKGIGEKRAEDIIAGRPYEKIDDLVVKGILTQSLFTSLEGSLQL